MVTTSFPRYSGDAAGSVIKTLARSLVDAGVGVTVVAPHDASAPLRETIDGVEVRRFIYTIPASLQRLAYGDGIPDNIKNSRLAKLQAPLLGLAGAAEVLAAARDADLIHAFWTMSAVIAAPAVIARRTPLLLRLLGDGIRLAPRWLNRIALSVADGVCYATDELAEHLATYGYRGPLFVTRNQMDPHRLDTSQSLEPPLAQWCAAADAVVTFIGRFVPVKDPVGVAKAVPHVLARHPRTRFLFVGAGPLKKEMMQCIQAAGAAENVRFTGTRNDIGAVLRASTVFVANSPVTNCYSSAIIEALTVGVPAVITDVGDPKGSFRSKDYVELVSPADPADLARGINRLLDDAQLRHRRIETGRQFITDYGFTPEAVLAQHLHAYETILTRRRRKPVGL